jgi:hypothetical protein
MTHESDAVWQYDPGREAQALVDRARAGEVDAAREALRLFVDTVRDATTTRGAALPGTGYNLPDPLIAYVAECLGKVVSAKAPTRMQMLVALNLTTGRRGRRRTDEQEQRESSIAMEVFWLAHRNRASGVGAPVESALGHVATRVVMSIAAVRKIYEAKLRNLGLVRPKRARKAAASDPFAGVDFGWLLGTRKK